jgi:hypothetical protein
MGSMKLPQVSLRDLFWLVLVVGMGLGWWIDHQKPVPQAPPPVLPQTGRWQFVMDGNGKQVMVDTTTGELWTYDTYHAKWGSRRSPPK